MEVVIKKTQEKACLLGAALIARQVREKEFPVLGLATGSSPIPLYKELVRQHKDEGLSFERVKTFNLDEYVGLDPRHPGSFHSVMEQELFSHVNIPSDARHVPNGMSSDLGAVCAEYEALILAAGGIDIQLLGIGGDGHLGFNEPGSSLASRTRLKTLSRETLIANAVPFGNADKVPRHVLTMGLETILEAKICLVLAFGPRKAQAVRDMVEGPLTASCPASVLQMHPKTIVLLDEESASLLKRKQYYKDVYEGKPTWQRWD